MSSNNQGVQSTRPNPLGEEPKAATGGSAKWIGAAAAAAMVVALAGGGIAFARTMGGGGAQPEDVLPGNAIAFVKVDLNPSAGQKLALFQLASKFPKVKSKVTSQDSSLKESAFGSIFTSDPGLGLSYKKDVEPWLGDRIGLGVFPDMDSDKKPEVGLAIAFSNQVAAKSALDRAIRRVTKSKHKITFGYAFADGYVIVSDTTAHAAALVTAGKVNTLARSTYAEDVTRLGSDQIVVAWADIAAVYKAVPKDLMAAGQPTGFAGAGDPKNASGRYVAGLHADSSFLELNGKGIDIKGAAAQYKPGARSGMITSFPADILEAATINGLGKAVGTLYTSLTTRGDPMGVKVMLSGTGIDSAKKIETLLGAETGVLVAGTKDNPEFAIRTRGGNTPAALAIARRALRATPAGEAGATVRRISGPDGIVVSLGSDLTASIFEKSGSKLGASGAFRHALPDAARADVVEYVNLAKLVPMLTEGHASSADKSSLRPLNAVGLTFTGGAEPSMRLRLSFK